MTRTSYGVSLLLGVVFFLGPEANLNEHASSVSFRSAQAAPQTPSKRQRRGRSSIPSRSRPRKAPPRTRAAERLPPAAETPIPLSTRGPTRIDFDDRLVQGQTNQSGAVVLFARKASGLRSMVDRRKSFRERTLRTIFDR